VSLSGGVDDLIDGLHGEVEGHELALDYPESVWPNNLLRSPVSGLRGKTHNGVQTSEGSTNGDTSKSGLCDGSVNDTLGAEAVQKTPRHLVAVKGSA
jgi:hypothetical protein